MRKHLSLATVLFLVLVLGCGSDSGPSDPGGGEDPTVDLTGTYNGVVTGTAYGAPFSMAITFTMVQNGNQVTGTWMTSEGSSGTGQGTIAGSQIDPFRLNQTQPCAGVFSGTADIRNNGNALEGSYTGDDCYGYVNASFSVTRM